MEFQANIPIYVQLMDLIKLQIVAGTLKPGEKLKSVREFALEYGVNPNTMQRALAELEWQGLLYTMRTTGRYVTEDSMLISRLREQLAAERIDTFFEEMRRFGFHEEEIKQLLKQYIREE